MVDSALLLGCDARLLVRDDSLQCDLQADVLTALHDLRARAAAAGFDLRVASGYRSFERQLLIWNNKALGLRPVLDDRGLPLDIKRLGERDLVLAILRWSALPGASRHHWGTDLDVYDAAAMPAGYQLQLTQAETEGDGVFAPFHRWLDDELQRPGAVFYRPYAQDTGGIAPEPWHLSYAPLAKAYAQQLSEALLRDKLAQTDIQLKSTLLAHLGEIVARFVRVD